MDLIEYHPYKPFIPLQSRKLIVGNFPIGKFSNPARFHERKSGEVDFYYGGATNKLWRLLSKCFGRPLTNIKEIKSFLKDHHFALADILLSCRRMNGSALDTALYDKTYNTDLRKMIEKENFEELLFTSRHVYTQFRKHIGKFPHIKQTILISPSPTAVRGLVKNKEYLELKKKNRDLSIEEFRLMKYKQIFS
jgi:G:T/U-mismatch repair DNA glycosylase